MMNDLISRQAAVDEIKALRPFAIVLDDSTELHADYDIEYALSKLPSVERKKGKWVKARGSWCTPGGDPVWECSLCGKGVHVYGIEHGTYGSDIADGQWIACPNCGAEMVDEA